MYSNGLIQDIDREVRQIEAQRKLGGIKAGMVKEQSNALFSTLSNLPIIGFEVVIAVRDHLANAPDLDAKPTCCIGSLPDIV